MDWSVDYCDVFKQLFGLILTAPIHCRGSIGEQIMEWEWYISLNLFQRRNKLIYVLDGRVSEF